MQAAINTDVTKGVLEKVTLGTADTWCTRMVIMLGKLGKPRRTIDQAGDRTGGTGGHRCYLNEAATLFTAQVASLTDVENTANFERGSCLQLSTHQQCIGADSCCTEPYQQEPNQVG